MGHRYSVIPAELLCRNLCSHLPSVGQHGQAHSSAPLRPARPEVAVHGGLRMLQVKRLPLQRCSGVLLPIQGQRPNHARQCHWLSLHVELTGLSMGRTHVMRACSEEHCQA